MRQQLIKGGPGALECLRLLPLGVPWLLHSSPLQGALRTLVSQGLVSGRSHGDLQKGYEVSTGEDYSDTGSKPIEVFISWLATTLDSKA